MPAATEVPATIVSTEMSYLAGHAEGLALLILDTLSATEIDEGRLEAAHASMGILYDMVKRLHAEVDTAEGRELDARRVAEGR